MHFELIYSMLTVFCICAVMVSVLIPLIVRYAVRNKIYDVPDARKVHTGNVPRLGGLAFLPAIFLALLLIFSTHIPYVTKALSDTDFPLRDFLCVGLGGFIVFVTGIFDDFRNVRYRHKFLAQIMAAVMLCVGGIWINDLHGFFGIHQIPAWAGMPLTILVVVLIINSINLIDGIDGLASGICILGIGVYTLNFADIGYNRYALLGIATLGCLIPFYIFNVFGKPEKRTKVFMGDTGSLVIGYLMAFFAIRVSTLDGPAKEMPLYFVSSYSILLVPVFDVVRVFCKRMLKGNNPFLPDKSHIHHKFLALGFGMRQARWLIFIVCITCYVMNMMLVKRGVNVTFIVLIDLILWCVFQSWLTSMIVKKEINI